MYYYKFNTIYYRPSKEVNVKQYDFNKIKVKLPVTFN